jgi:hypothetical protein
MQVYVLLFNARTENEGIHSLQMDDRNLILMFESEDDATRYALLLEAQDFMTPTVETIDSEEIEEFCQSTGYICRLVPRGYVPTTNEERLLFSPPERNVIETDWQQEAEGREQPETAASDDASSDISESELERMRRRLENLL